MDYSVSFALNLRFSLLIFHSITYWIFYLDCVESMDQVLKNLCLDNNEFSFHVHGISLHLLSFSLISLISFVALIYAYFIISIPKYLI